MNELVGTYANYKLIAEMSWSR